MGPTSSGITEACSRRTHRLSPRLKWLMQGFNGLAEPLHAVLRLEDVKMSSLFQPSRVIQAEHVVRLRSCMQDRVLLDWCERVLIKHNDLDGTRAEHCGARVYLGNYCFGFHPIACKQRLLVAPWNMKR